VKSGGCAWIPRWVPRSRRRGADGSRGSPIDIAGAESTFVGCGRVRWPDRSGRDRRNPCDCERTPPGPPRRDLSRRHGSRRSGRSQDSGSGVILAVRQGHAANCAGQGCGDRPIAATTGSAGLIPPCSVRWRTPAIVSIFCRSAQRCCWFGTVRTCTRLAIASAVPAATVAKPQSWAGRILELPLLGWIGRLA